MKAMTAVLLVMAATLLTAGCPSSGQLEFPGPLPESGTVYPEGEVAVPEEPAAACGTEDLIGIASGSLGTKTCTLCQPCTFSLAAEGGSGEHSWAFTGLPPGLSNTGGDVAGVPTELFEGQVAFVVTDVSCPTNHFVGTFQVKVGDIPAENKVKIAVLDSTPMCLTYSEYYTPPTCEIPLTATGCSRDGICPYIWEMSGLPEGLAYDPATGLISGKPPVSAKGLHTVNIRVRETSCEKNAAEGTIQIDVVQPI
ncbi:MAG: putative Ig domain-containing protein [Proteobacteria bacterium]|nr:putative Ig domain-containing protein [Pseudomonadota bacterium]